MFSCNEYISSEKQLWHPGQYIYVFVPTGNIDCDFRTTHTPTRRLTLSHAGKLTENNNSKMWDVCDNETPYTRKLHLPHAHAVYAEVIWCAVITYRWETIKRIPNEKSSPTHVRLTHHFSSTNSEQMSSSLDTHLPILVLQP